MELSNILDLIENARLKYSAHHIVKLIAVSKYASTEQIKFLYQSGQRAFGENKVQDLRQKCEILQNLPLEWHFLGHLQNNKINALLDLKPSLFHALDSVILAQDLQKKLSAKNQILKCLLQVNISNESQKNGVSLENAGEIYCQIAESYPNIELVGIMGINQNTSDTAILNRNFSAAKKLFDSLKNAKILSLGMSNDFELAIANGANLLRIGSKIFD